MKEIQYMVGEKGKLPSKAYEGDAGFDLYTSEKIVVEPHSFINLPVDICVAFPEGIWGMITGRSSTIRNYKLRVETAIIDNGYRGELFVGVWNLSDCTVVVESGMRVAQLIPFDLVPLKWTKVTELPRSDRGDNSFGSSGI